MNTSLTKFCKDHNLPKSSVYRRCQELNIDTTDGLTPDACDRLRHEFDVELPVQPEPPDTTRVSVEVTTSDIMPINPLQLPIGSQFNLNAALAQIDGAKGDAFDDPTAIVDAVEVLLDQVEHALDHKLDQQQQKLNTTQQQVTRLYEKKAEFKLKTAIAANESRKLATAQTQATQQLQQAYQEVLQLGKSPQDASESGSAP